MAASQNGYSANDRTMIASYTIPGTTLKIALRKGDVSVVILEYLRRYHVEVESLYNNPQDLWGYAERTIIGSSTTLSNHASGTAADARATRHVLGKRGTFTARELQSLNRLLAYFEGVLRHGKDYSGRVDEMHVEINKGPAEVARIANKIRQGAAAPAPTPEDDLTPDQDRLLRVIFDQITGNNFTGWPTWPDGTGESLSLVDYARRDNVEVRQLHVNANALHQKVDALAERVGQLSSGDGSVAPTTGPASLTDADVNRIATRVIDLLSERTRS